jgi:hypothetical protein
MKYQRLQHVNSSRINATLHVDYENIVELLKRYGKSPLEMDFFQLFYII